MEGNGKNRETMSTKKGTEQKRKGDEKWVNKS